MGTIVVTGGAGFIGCNFVRLALAETSDRVVVVDKLTYAGNLESLDDVARDPAVRLRPGRHRRSGRGPRCLPGAPARGGRQFRRRDPRGPFHRRPRGFRPDQRHRDPRAPRGRAEPRRAPWAAPARAAFRFLHVSTDEVYGTLGATGLFSETTPYAPNSPYAASKAAADHLVRAYQETYGLPVLITNCSNNYGPYQFPEKLIPLMILNALEGRPLPIYGDGGNVRDWLFVEDHCAGILLVLQRGRVGEKYNIGGGGEQTNLEVVDRICAALEAERPAAAERRPDRTRHPPLRGPQDVRPRPPRPRPPLRHRRHEDRRGAGLASAPRLRVGDRAHGALVPRPRGLVRVGSVGLSPPRAPGARSRRMKGIILAGGSGSRLYPLTLGVSKQLVPDLRQADGLLPALDADAGGDPGRAVITTPHEQESFRRLLGDGSDLGIRISYAAQPRPEGLAQAFLIGREFIGRGRRGPGPRRQHLLRRQAPGDAPAGGRTRHAAPRSSPIACATRSATASWSSTRRAGR